MSILDKLHDQAMEAAFLADLERRKGNEEDAAKLFEKALDLERQAIAEMTTPVEPTWSILHRSAGWLALDCNRPRQAEQLACIALTGDPPPEIADELRDLLEQANSRRHLELKGLALQDDELQLTTPAMDFPAPPVMEQLPDAEAEPVEIRGVLQYADAIKKNEIKVVDKGKTQHVEVPEGMMDDIVRPMWNSRVVISATRTGSTITLRDIRPDDQD